MRFAKAIVLGLGLFGAVTAGVGSLVRILIPLLATVGLASTLYIVVMLTLFVGLVAYFMHKSPF